MRWIMDRAATVSAAVGVKRFAIDGTVGVGLILLQAIASRWEGWPFKAIPDWLFGVVIVLFLINWWLLNYATRLRLEKLPRLTLEGLDVHPGKQVHVRVRVRSESTDKISGVKARIVAISDEIGALKSGELMNLDGTKSRINYPIQLFTSERLKERLGGGDASVRPFDLAAEESKLLEVFHTGDSAGDLRIYNVEKEHSLITPDDMTFHCEVHGAGAPIKFAVKFEHAPGDTSAFTVELTDATGTILDTKTLRKPSNDAEWPS